MEFSNNKPKINNGLKEFIEDNIELIENKEFEELYKKAHKLACVGDFTHVLYSVGIDPLEDLTYIPGSFFEGCDALVEVDIPIHIEHIDESAFYACDNISSITIPKNVIELGSWSLAGCDNLRKIVILGDLKKIGRLTFGQLPRLEVIYCTQQTADLLNTDEWIEVVRKKAIKIEVIK